MKSKDLNKKTSAKKASLGRVIKKNEKIKETVKDAATKLTSVNKALKQEKVPVQVIKQALVQNEDIEHKVAKAAVDLKLVNARLTKELAERTLIETELADTKTDLAEVREDLSRTESLTYHNAITCYYQSGSLIFAVKKAAFWGMSVRGCGTLIPQNAGAYHGNSQRTIKATATSLTDLL